MQLQVWGWECIDRRERRGGRAGDTERSYWRCHVEGSALGAVELGDVTRPLLRQWMDRLLATPHRRKPGACISPKTAREVLAVVRIVLEEAMERGHVTFNAARGMQVGVPIRRIEEPWTFLTLDEQRALATCAAIPEAERLRILFAMLTGLRQGEQWNLELGDVHFHAPVPYVHVRIGGWKKGQPTPRKPNRPARVPLNRSAAAVLARWLVLLPSYAPSNPLGLVFPTQRGCRRLRSHVYGWHEQRALAGIARRVRWHDLRHTCASSLVGNLWSRRWSLRETQEALGHASARATERYAHLLPSAIAEAASQTELSGLQLVSSGITPEAWPLTGKPPESAPELAPADMPGLLQDSGPGPVRARPRGDNPEGSHATKERKARGRKPRA